MVACANCGRLVCRSFYFHRYLFDRRGGGLCRSGVETLRLTARFARGELSHFAATLSHLESTYRSVPASVDSKPLTRTISPLDATFTKKGGGWPVIVN